MAKSSQKIMLKGSRDLPFNKLVFKVRVSIEGLAVIRRHGLRSDASVALSDEEIATLAERAEGLPVRSGWLSEPLLTPGRTITAARPNFPQIRRLISAPQESAGSGYKTAMADPDEPAQDEPVATEPHAVAAEKGVPVHKRPAGNGGPFGLGADHVHASF